MNDDILDYQQKCYHNYLIDIRKKLSIFPTPYIFPTGNPIRPLPPIKTALNNLMIIGAYPSARFESYFSSFDNRCRLIPSTNNLQPFADEEYFDGVKVRQLESGKGLRTYLLNPLNIHPDDCWITNLVKVFLYKNSHRESIVDIFPDFFVPDLRDEFINIGKQSLSWIQEEISICKPKLVITLGEEVAQVISGENKSADNLLTTKIKNPESLEKIDTIYTPHPDACHRFEKWRKVLVEQIKLIKNHLKN